MEKIAAIVEGHTEAHFVKSTYGAVHVTRAIPNGKDVALDVIIEAIVDVIEVLGGSISKILILLDREDRQQDVSTLSESIRAGVQHKCHNRSLYIGITDRQIENWIVADEEKMRGLFDDGHQYLGDGSYGKPALQKLNAGIFMAPGDTALLLKSCSAQRISQKSPSLQNLLASIDFEWQWAKS